ncbi:Cell wall-associated hydrolase, NlpC family [Amycolatopsis pretoriensis]|uniref:Cell wall-associated hydrolase, NlpC family n=1 Tax=Amycolatopsis pretoriensis TaxID=218821 RepID=A0A1H5RFR4_9PSEU|nr:C40 family peptidase [Amycolatopsis pretoriensis]SEF36884.1 Cell wall-associated hydrolase, NlpC family [Amycolatopsis pretoriensis]
MKPRGMLAGVAGALGGLVFLPILVLALMIGPAATATIVQLSGCDQGGPGGGSIVVDRQQLGADEMDIARTVVDVVQQRRLPRRAAVLAIATGMVESGLRNLDYGDRDSLGVFQQRPSQGWGTREQILNPVYATGKFLDALIALPGWDTMAPGHAEQAVQHSGFPDRYAPREPAAAAIVDQFWTGPDNPTPPAGGGTKAVQVKTLCPDQGGSDVPRDPSQVDPTKLPPGFTLPTDVRQRAAVGFALGQLGKPYVWGAKGPDAYDCSGLMLAAWAAAGIGIPAGTISQAHAGHAVSSLEQVQPGDLLFIPGSRGTAQVPRHVGMYAGHGLIVDAYDTDTGVILEPLSAWTSKIVAIRRIADPGLPSPPPGGSPLR